MLQSVAEKYGKDGAELLAVSMDGPETRSRIPDYIQKHDVRARVFLMDREEIPFDLRFVGSTFLIDREGKVAGVPSEFFASDMREVLERKIPDLLAGRPAPGPLLLTLEKAPPDFGILWQRPLESTVKQLAIVPASGGEETEVGVLEAQKLRRFNGSGEFKDQVAVESWRSPVRALQGADLDGNGRNEWVMAYPNGFDLLSDSGERIGGFTGFHVRVLGYRDLDGDGLKEIIIQAGERVAAMRALPGQLWSTESLGSLQAARMDPYGEILVQRGDRVSGIDRTGRIGRPLFRAPRGKQLLGSLVDREGRIRDLFGAETMDQELDLNHDLDGDSVPEIIVARDGGLLAVGLDGSIRLLVKVEESLQAVQFAAGNLDGRPGDELILVIPHYGLVALGRKAPPSREPSSLRPASGGAESHGPYGGTRH